MTLAGGITIVCFILLQHVDKQHNQNASIMQKQRLTGIGVNQIFAIFYNNLMGFYIHRVSTNNIFSRNCVCNTRLYCLQSDGSQLAQQAFPYEEHFHILATRKLEREQKFPLAPRASSMFCSRSNLRESRMQKCSSYGNYCRLAGSKITSAKTTSTCAEEI